MRITFFSLLFILIFSGCEKIYYYEYVIKNETNNYIKIVGYDRFEFIYTQNETIIKRNSDLLLESESISIDPHSQYSVIKTRGFHAEPEGIFSDIHIDSVNIIFNNNRILTQFCDSYPSLRTCNVKRNIMGYDSEYKREKVGRSSREKEYRFTYTITEEDYNNAIPIIPE